ncbi:MAG: HD domain-containing protein [bacterium]|nr:HD domain-containing protein [bacterium]
MIRNYQDLVILLARGINQRRMYFEDHPRVIICAQEFCTGLNRLQNQDGKGKFFIGVVDGKLIHEGKYLIGPTIIGSHLNKFAQLLGCGGFLFNKGVTPGEIRTFFTFAMSQKSKLGTLEESRKLLRSKNLSTIELSPPYEDAGWFGEFLFEKRDNGQKRSQQDQKIDELMSTFQNLYSSVETAHDAGHSGQCLDLDQTRSTSEELIKATRGQVPDIMQLVKYPDYDTYTVGHSVRVAMFAVLVGKHLNLDKGLLNELGVAAMLHDVGKSRIPADILFKPSRLDERERAVMEGHPTLGAEMLLENPDASDLAIAVAWGHHRRFDLQGYPKMPWGSAESQLTHIINVCDVFEALTAIRPYKKSHTPRRAFEIMFSDSGWFCPMALSSFCSAVGMYPPGSAVKLTDGHQALVVAPSEVFDRPLIKLTHDPNQRSLPQEAQVEVNLATHSIGVKIKELILTD